jgi:plasmid stability protein
MSIEVRRLASEAVEWLENRAHSRGTSIETEAAELLDDAVQDRMRRERIFLSAANARIRLPGPPLTAEEIEQAVNWGRD